MKNFLIKTFWEPLKRNIPILMTVGGLLLIFVGAILGDAIDLVFPKGTGDSLQKIGGAILGGGVFAVLMKSAQFTDFFQKCLSDVLYNPHKTVSLPLLKEKWAVLTRALLRDTLPSSYQDASEVILSSFLDNELEHHFENYHAAYDFCLEEDGRTLRIRQEIKTDIVISPRFDSTEIRQVVTVDGDVRLISMIVDGKAQDVTTGPYIQQSANDSTEKIFSMRLSPSNGCPVSGDKKVTLERVYEIFQDISREPYFIVNFSRYIKGFTIKSKASNCQLYFRRTGPGAEKFLEATTDGEGYNWRTLADRNTLLLPGQGFIFVVTAPTREEVAS